MKARAAGPEQMDADDLDPATYAAILTDLAQVNRATLAARPTLAFLERAGLGEAFSLLDVGYGHGDMLRAIRRRFPRAVLAGIDLNPRSEPVARAATPAGMAIDWRTGDLFADDARHDVIVSSLVAHHMDDAELIGFLGHMETHATRGWLVNDLRRSRIAHAGYPWLARAMGWHRIVREDGRLSIARSFVAADWRRLLAAAGIPAAGVRIVRYFPFRLCVERLR